LLVFGCSSPPEDVDAGPDGGAVDAFAVDAELADAPSRPFPSFPSLLPESGGRTLFVGNSYTFYSDLPAVHAELATELELMPAAPASVTDGGYTLRQHADDAATDGTPLARFLRTGSPDERAWDVVVLQEQSQIPGFPDGSGARLDSEMGASELAGYVDASDGSVVLYLTWGRERGDETNPDLFPDFTAMEAALEAGYRAIAARLIAEDRAVRIAPVGPAFARIHDAVIAAGGDPSAEGSAFDALYDPDGSHPSALGTYLATCVILSTITGRDPETFADALSLSPADAAALRAVAHDTLADPMWTPTAP
jgi:hypothetical protein